MKTIDSGRQAVIVVDYQNDFGKPGAPLYVKEGETLAPVINALMRNVKIESGLVIATRDWHPEKSVHFDSWPRHCVAGTEGADYAGGFDRSLVDIEIFKGYKDSDDGYSGFEGVTRLSGDRDAGFEIAPGAKTLREVLLENNIRVVKIVGLATDFCVKATALDAVRDFDTVVYEQGIRSVDLQTGDGERAIEAMRQAGVKISSQNYMDR